MFQRLTSRGPGGPVFSPQSVLMRVCGRAYVHAREEHLSETPWYQVPLGRAGALVSKDLREAVMAISTPFHSSVKSLTGKTIWEIGMAFCLDHPHHEP